MRTAIVRLVLISSPLFLSTGCIFMGDLPPDPAVAPIEVVARRDACLLNRDSVATGTHDVTVIIEHGSGRVRLLNGDQVVQELTVSAAPTPVALTRGDHTVECVVDGSRSTAELTVT